MPNPLTTTEVKAAIGNTWFDAQDDNGKIMLDTRDHGNLGEETPGKKDIEEGRRITKALKAAYPQHEVSFEIVDEWVIVDIRTTPKSQAKLAEEAKAQKVMELTKLWAPKIENAFSQTEAEMFGEQRPQNHKTPFYWRNCIEIQENGNTVIPVVASFGERILYRDHPQSIPAFLTAEEARQAAEKIAATLGGKIRGQKQTRICERETYNYNPPNNIIERTGTTFIDIEIL